MTRKVIRARDLHEKWKQEPEYVEAYDAFEEEFAIASALIKVRADADLTQQQVAERMVPLARCAAPEDNLHFIPIDGRPTRAIAAPRSQKERGFSDGRTLSKVGKFAPFAPI
jgi:hypothetical protein